MITQLPDFFGVPSEKGMPREFVEKSPGSGGICVENQSLFARARRLLCGHYLCVASIEDPADTRLDCGMLAATVFVAATGWGMLMVSPPSAVNSARMRFPPGCRFLIFRI